jgi:intein/homing endonuclease
MVFTDLRHLTKKEKLTRKLDMLEQALALYTEHPSVKEVSEKLGLNRATLTRWLQEAGVSILTPKEAGIKKSLQHEYDRDIFQRSSDPNVAYIIGFVMGDGCVHDSRKRKRLVITLAEEDVQILRDMARYMGVEHLIKRQEKQVETEQRKVSLVLNATDLCSDLISLGVEPRKTGSEKFIAFNQEHCTWAFIRGFFDADGNIRVYKRPSRNGEKLHTKAIFRITSNREILEEIKQYFITQGIIREGCLSERGMLFFRNLEYLPHSENIRKNV